MNRCLVSGGAGFIGSHLVDRLMLDGWSTTVVDNFDPFYSPEFKWKNISSHIGKKNFSLIKADIRDLAQLKKSLNGNFDVIFHLAAKAGVRPSIDDPVGYQQVNVMGTQNLLELARDWGVKKFVFASSSSVYGINPNVPWREEDHVLMPISPYASTKVSGELLGHVYSHLYDIQFLALRLFTVYGPRQRPDLAIHKFCRLILDGKPIPIFGDGSSKRDYTYVGDIINGFLEAVKYERTRYEIINLGNNRTISLRQMIHILEEVLGKEAVIKSCPMQPGDVPKTWADITKAQSLLSYCPNTNFFEGVKIFVNWIRSEAFILSGENER